MTIRLVSVGLTLAYALQPVCAFAIGVPASPSASACLENLYDAFGREQRLERAVLFGKPNPDDAANLSVFYDNDGNAWVKTGRNTWKSPADGYEGTTWSDIQMKNQSEKDTQCEAQDRDMQAACVKTPRRGIFEIRKTPTSDLIEPIVQSVRALQCRLRAVCELASQSPGKNENEILTIKVDGCMPMTFAVMNGCRELSPTVLETLPGMCQRARQQLVEREMQLLMLTVSYDANYRGLAQFAGMFQEFLTQFRFPLIEPIWQMVRTLGQLKGIPCFSAECNE